MAFLEYHSYHLVGIKGVALTALAQCLLDAGKTVTGSDVAENFVTHGILERLPLSLQTGFDQALPAGTECVIYTAAHGGNTNPQVVLAQQQQIPVLSHAQALGELFNQKQGIAVCGVGGKSTTSAMIAWILENTGHNPSFAIGVGNIPGLNKTGKWNPESATFVAEADEYAEQPKPQDTASQADWKLVPRFHYMHPLVTVCTNLKYDHPDVYANFEETQVVYQAFFAQMKPEGTLICNATDLALIKNLAPASNAISFGEGETADFKLTNYQASTGTTTATFTHENQEFTLQLKIPGKFNVFNALAAIAASVLAGVTIPDAVIALENFHSTMRRFEFIGEKKGVTYYDDYAHHPHEVAQAIQALREWYPQQRNVIMFQSHTYSRTKELLDEFVAAFKNTTDVVMIDIFPSARESFDPSITSDIVCDKIKAAYPQVHATNVKTLEALAEYCKTQLHPGDVVLTLGAGDIYRVHDML